MLPSKFEPRKASRAQCAPKLLFLLSLFPSKTPRVPGRIHPLENKCFNKLKQRSDPWQDVALYGKLEAGR